MTARSRPAIAVLKRFRTLPVPVDHYENFPGRIVARARRGCAAPSSRSTRSRAAPTTSPTRATPRRPRAPRRARSLRGACSIASQRGEQPDEPPFAALDRRDPRARAAARAACATCSPRSGRTSSRRATPISPRCWTTARARPTRSAGCCCTCTASTRRGVAATLRRDLHRRCSSSISGRTWRSTGARSASTFRRTTWGASAWARRQIADGRLRRCAGAA